LTTQTLPVDQRTNRPAENNTPVSCACPTFRLRPLPSMP